MDQESGKKSYQDQVQESLKNNRWIVWIVLFFIAISSVVSFIGGVKDIAPANERKNEDVKQIVIELQDALALLPVQQSFSDCLDRRKDLLMSVIEACMRERRQSQVDPRVIIGKVYAKVSVDFDADKRELISSHLREMDYIAYEMQNNQTVMEYWLREGCGRSIEITNSPPKAPVLGVERADVKCTLVVQGRDEFMRRQSENSDRVSQMRKSFMRVNDANSFIVVGGSDTIDGYFNRANNLLYSEFLRRHEAAISLISSVE